MTGVHKPETARGFCRSCWLRLSAIINPDTHNTRFIDGAAGQLSLLGVMFAFYLGVRGITQASEDLALANAYEILKFEAKLGINWERDVQQYLLDRSNLMSFFNWFYAWTYWPVLAGSLILLWWRDRHRYLLFRDALIVSGAIGLVIFTFYPVAPPRFLDGFVDTVSATSRHVIAHPSALMNPFAALPSFHVGWHTLSALMIASMVSSKPLRVLIMTPSAIMAFTVVVTANHYIVDAALGLFLSICGLLAIKGLRKFPQADSGAEGAADNPEKVEKASNPATASV